MKSVKHIKMAILSSSNEKVVHAAVHLNHDTRDVGTMYLTRPEYEDVLSILQKGCIETDTDISIDDNSSVGSDTEYEY